MFDLDSKTDAQWRARIEELKEEHTDRLVELQKELDRYKYSAENTRRDLVKTEYLITYILDYFLNERKIKVTERDLDLFYLQDILDKYYGERDV